MAVNRGPRNQSLLRQISEKNPFKTLAADFLDISSGFERDMQAVRANRKLSAEGKQNEARDHLRKALRAREDRQKPLAEFHAQTEAMKAKVKLPDYDKADDYAARLRAEMRDRSYDMTPLERMGLMSGPNRSVAFIDAVFETAPFVSGLREKGELDVYAAAKEERLAELHGPLQDVIAARRGTESEIRMLDNMVWNDLASDSGLSREDFEAVAKQIESKATAEALKTTPRDHIRQAIPEQDIKLFSPEEEAAFWRPFDELVAGMGLAPHKETTT
jgi:hypothetical protein